LNLSLSVSVAEIKREAVFNSKCRAGTVFFLTDDGCLVSNNHVVNDPAKVRLVMSAKPNEEGRMKNEETKRQPL